MEGSYVAFSLLGMVAILIVAWLIVSCHRRTGEFTSTDFIRRNCNEIAATQPRPTAVQPIPEAGLELATIERSLSHLARERPTRFSAHQLENFTRSDNTRIGEGSFGSVYKGCLPNGIPVAIKVYKADMNKRIEESFMAELITISQIHHVNIVCLYGFCFDSMLKALVYEYMENGSLDRFLFDKNKTIEWEKLHNIAIGTAKGIAYLHEECRQPIIHFDIKPSSVLLDTNLSPKLTGFELATLYNRESPDITLSSYRGTPGYAAPELWQPMPVTHKCDVYSFGMMLFEIVGRRHNFNHSETESEEWFPKFVWEKFEKGNLAEVMDICGIERTDREKAERTVIAALWCVQYQPEQRPLMSTVVKMLEGWSGESITAPPNPFSHLASSSAGAVEFIGSSSPSEADKDHEEV